MKRRSVLLASIAAVAALATLLGGVLQRESGQARASAATGREEVLASGFAAGARTPALIAELETSVAKAPRNVRAHALLGLAYQQRARETTDPAYYPRSARALRRALALAPRDLLATNGLGSLALSRHRFREALALGRRAQRIAPGSARAYGIIGDALLELGRYREAFAAFDRLAALKPGLSAYARISYARELLGRQEGAVAAMRLALDAAGARPEPVAWAHVQLGQLESSRGRVGAARRHFRAALTAVPGYAAALDARADLEGSEGNLRLAVRLLRQALDAAPSPHYAEGLADLYLLAGRDAAARKLFARVDALYRREEAFGTRTALERAHFQLDHGIRLREALALARVAQRERPSVDGDDALAWALVRNGRCKAALPYAERALRLGMRDGSKLFHRGMVERCLGNERAAHRWFRHALRVDARFSVLWAPVARQILNEQPR